jgi:hypothetical protein
VGRMGQRMREEDAWHGSSLVWESIMRWMEGCVTVHRVATTDLLLNLDSF